MLEQNVAYRTPEIAPIRGEGVLVVGFDISLFRGLDLLQGLRRFLVVIERGKESRFHAGVQLLHLRGIQLEIRPAERPDADQFHLPLEDIDPHRQFIQPTAAKLAPPEIDTVIVREFSTLL